MICVSPYIYIYILFCQVLLIRGSAEFGCVGDGGNVSVSYIYIALTVLMIVFVLMIVLVSVHRPIMLLSTSWLLSLNTVNTND